MAMWACENGHEVREGMFRCPECGSDDVGERTAEGSARRRPVAVGRAKQRSDALAEISSRITTGVVLVVAGFLMTVVALGSGGTSDIATLIGLVAYVVIAVGFGFILVGAVGHGVRLGLEASRADQHLDDSDDGA